MGRYILVVIIFLSQLTYAVSGLGMDTGELSYEQITQHTCRDCSIKSLVTACKLLGVETTLDRVSNLFKPNDDITMYDLYKMANMERLNI